MHGEACFTLKLIRKELAQSLVPADARIVCVWPGRTIAVLFLARYRGSPVGEYQEIIVAPALIRLQGKLGFWISHILVDSDLSILAGRSIWALPKEHARMQWQSAPETRIRIEAPTLKLQAGFASPAGFVPLPFIGTALSKRGIVTNSFVVRGAARVGVTHADIELSGDPGLHQLGLSGPRRMYVCTGMNISIGPPRPASGSLSL